MLTTRCNYYNHNNRQCRIRWLPLQWPWAQPVVNWFRGILDDLGGTIIALDCNTVILKESVELIIIIQHHHCWRNIETRIPIVTMMLQVRRTTSLSRRFSLGGSSNGYNFSTIFEFIYTEILHDYHILQRQ